MIVRGAYFCPSAVHCIAAYLQIPTNNMILGVPDTDFAFPLSKLKGVRIAVPRSDKAIRDNTCAHLRDIINAATVPLPDITEMKAPNSPTKLRTISQILSIWTMGTQNPCPEHQVSYYLWESGGRQQCSEPRMGRSRHHEQSCS
jgi:hypothetical protein